MKYKIGDRVKVIPPAYHSPTGFFGHYTGDVGYISDISYSNYVVIVPGRISTSDMKPGVAYGANQLRKIRIGKRYVSR